ncbi:bacterial regulatory helix-turn-helix s, AraC family protein [Pseudarthrobacter siccitolerans]|uniref:Bacterial regulatory helix-turn-helix s, AraC family protein n=1 Tax=Pseudarthrobacter siccitolerans TaxID=861266 RepID=A0A024H8X2_9MICC|nr:AraC family transcriptional regulator [Pseudarthrobacter siccitolerans]CCQ48206.1 bacterial regulatory helix-turn-helix s, AraC family protein [Pseudarthrobacter siccitolerans]
MEYGLDPAPSLRAANLSPDVIDVPGGKIGWNQELVFQEHFASQTSEQPEIWVEAARRYTPHMLGEFGLAMITAPTLRHFRNLGTRLGYGVGRYVAFDIDPFWTGYEFRLPHHIGPTTAFFRFTIINEIITGVMLYNDIWQGPLPFERVEVPIDPLPVALTKAVEAPLVSCRGSGLRWVWHTSLLDTPLPRSNQMVHQEYVTRLERSRLSWTNPVQLHDKVSALLAQPGNAGLNLGQISAKLAIPARTLQRHLSEANISFRALRDEVRMREGSDLLTFTDLTVSEIARQVGYSEVASFSNAFRRWTGHSPSEFRSGSTVSEIDF